MVQRVHAAVQLGADIDALTSAIDALNASADLVVSSISGPLTPELRDALTRWVDAARAVATAIAGNYGAEEFNAAIAELNASKTSALDLCDAAYR